MRAIKTCVLGCTSTKPNRIKATSGPHVKPFIASYDQFEDMTDDEIHTAAATMLAGRMGWKGTLVSGKLIEHNCGVHVFIPHTMVLVDKLEYELLVANNQELMRIDENHTHPEN